MYRVLRAHDELYERRPGDPPAKPELLATKPNQVYLLRSPKPAAEQPVPAPGYAGSDIGRDAPSTSVRDQLVTGRLVSAVAPAPPTSPPLDVLTEPHDAPRLLDHRRREVRVAPAIDADAARVGHADDLRDLARVNEVAGVDAHARRLVDEPNRRCSVGFVNTQVGPALLEQPGPRTPEVSPVPTPTVPTGPPGDPRVAQVATRVRALRIALDRTDDAVDLLDRDLRVEFARHTTRVRGEVDVLEATVDRIGAGL